MKQTPLWFGLFVCLFNHGVRSCRETRVSVKTAIVMKGSQGDRQMTLLCQYYWKSGIEFIDKMKKSDVSCQEMLLHPTIFKIIMIFII